MTTYQSTTILQEVRNLITYSCRNESSRTGRFDTMHRAIIKKHFNASEVHIERGKTTINLNIEVRKGEYVRVNFECPDMEAFLKSCIEKDHTSLAFYQQMLTYYNVVANPAE
ncbi:MAG TPA: hypothetical protein VFM82_12435 [Flavobacteriaceae bacterium]|nr:hypothetical protein [Flavobacteriaceae bacterium]